MSKWWRSIGKWFLGTGNLWNWVLRVHIKCVRQAQALDYCASLCLLGGRLEKWKENKWNTWGETFSLPFSLMIIFFRRKGKTSGWEVEDDLSSIMIFISILWSDVFPSLASFLCRAKTGGDAWEFSSFHSRLIKENKEKKNFLIFKKRWKIWFSLSYNEFSEINRHDEKLTNRLCGGNYLKFSFNAKVIEFVREKHLKVHGFKKKIEKLKNFLMRFFTSFFSFHEINFF